MSTRGSSEYRHVSYAMVSLSLAVKVNLGRRQESSCGAFAMGHSAVAIVEGQLVETTSSGVTCKRCVLTTMKRMKSLHCD